MEKIKLSENWRVLSGSEADNFSALPESAFETVNLPFDALTKEARDYTVPCGAENSFYGSCVAVFYGTLPAAEHKGRALLEIEGLLGCADVYIGGRFVGFVSGRARKQIDITAHYRPNAVVALRIASHPDTGRYVGCGIAGGVCVIFQKNGLYIEPYGVRVETKASGDKALLGVFIEVCNPSASAAASELTVEIFNEKQKRVTRKLKKIKVPASGRKIFEIPVRFSRFYEWTKDDPYLYICAASLNAAGNYGQRVSFGIARHELSARAYRLNGKAIKLKGAVMAHDNGIVGAASDAAAEMRKLSAIKEIGYNAVRYIGCPTDAVLDTLDQLGLLCVVDIFDTLAFGRRSMDGHGNFIGEWEAVLEASVRTLRNHPCVAFYSVANDAEESYGRGKGYAFVKKLVDKIRELDPSALITANAFERAPDQNEAEAYELKLKAPYTEKQAIAAAREKDLFGKLTEEYFSLVDAAGYSGLYPRFSSDKSRFLLGLCDPGAKACAVYEEAEKNQHVAGCFLAYGADFLGSAAEEDSKSCVNRGGDVDITGRRKSGSYYKEILLGRRDVCSIVVQDPDAVDPDSPDHTTETHALWNWPRHVGKPVKVVVYTGGDIVSLTLDGKSIGRKLAGKFNDYTAVFKTNFYPGKLEAISFYKGVEHKRASLETVSAQPKSIRLECQKKIVAPGECTYVDIMIADKEGRTVPFASREVEVSVLEDGEPVHVGTADPSGAVNPAPNVCAVYDGRAVAVVRGVRPGKMIVKVTGEGLLSNKVTVKVK